MTGRPPAEAASRTREQARLLGLDRLSLFVPALMSVGLLFWVVSEITDLVRSHTDDVRLSRASVAADAVVDEALGRPTTHAGGLRPRPAYLVVAISALLASGYVVAGSTANYLRAGGYVAGDAWLLALAVLVGFVGLLFGGTALVVFLTWPVPPDWARGVLLRTPLGSATMADESDRRPSWATWTALLGSVGLLGALTALVAWSPEIVESFDRSVSDWFAGHDPLGALAVLHPVGATGRWLWIAATLGMLLAAFRCRVLLGAAAAGIIGVVVASQALGPLVAQARPSDPTTLARTESYPSLPMAFVVVFAGVLPLAVAVLFEHTWIIRPLRLALGVLAVATALHEIARGQLPTDVLGGVLLGLVAVVATQVGTDTERLHRLCHGCPWSPTPYHGPLLGAVRVHPSLHGGLRLTARLAAAVATLGLAVLTFTVQLPVDAAGYTLDSSVQRTTQLALTLLMSIGVLLSWRWEAAGAVIIAVAAAGAGVFASLEYRPGVAVLLTTVLMIPAVLLWLSWQHRHRPRRILVIAAVTAALIGTTWAGATTVHDHFFGPTHPASTAPSIPVDEVEWVWSGALTSRSITISARVVEGVADARVEAWPTTGGPAILTEATTPDRFRLVKTELTGLRPSTRYEYRVLIDGRPDEGRGFGSFTTPSDGAFSFTVTAASCARTGSNGAVYDTIRSIDPLLHLALGDMHYENIESTSPEAFIDAYTRALTTPAQSALARDVPVAYMWDDHDYGPNDADASFVGRSAVREAYRAAVPHYSVPEGDAPIEQAFTIGRVRFVLTDERSERTDGTMLGTAQLDWLLAELRSSSPTHAVVVWVNTVPWIGPAAEGADGWAGESAERALIADAVADAGIHNLVMVSGDAHMVAIDDGTNSDYSRDGGAGFPVLHAAALDRPGNVKGGPYSEGAYPGAGQFGVIDIRDDGGPTVTVELSGRNWRGETLVSYRTSFAAPG